MLREKHLHHNPWDQPAPFVKPVAAQVNCSHRPKTKSHILVEPRFADRFARLARNRNCICAAHLLVFFVRSAHYKQNARLWRASGVSASSCALMSVCQQQYDERGTWTFHQVSPGLRDLWGPNQGPRLRTPFCVFRAQSCSTMAYYHVKIALIP